MSIIVVYQLLFTKGIVSSRRFAETYHFSTKTKVFYFRDRYLVEAFFGSGHGVALAIVICNLVYTGEIV